MNVTKIFHDCCFALTCITSTGVHLSRLPPNIWRVYWAVLYQWVVGLQYEHKCLAKACNIRKETLSKIQTPGMRESLLTCHANKGGARIGINDGWILFFHRDSFAPLSSATTRAAARMHAWLLMPFLLLLSCQAIIIGDSMYVIGGGCFKPTSSITDVYKLDLKTLEVRMHAHHLVYICLYLLEQKNHDSYITCLSLVVWGACIGKRTQG